MNDQTKSDSSAEIERLQSKLRSLGQTPHPTYSTQFQMQRIESRIKDLTKANA